MSELDDLSICKRIAEIENIKLTIKCCYVNGFFSRHALMTNEHEEFNPLTDDALCFQLMVKYGLELTPFEDNTWGAIKIDKYNIYGEPDYKLCLSGSATDKSPNKAICMAISKLNKPS